MRKTLFQALAMSWLVATTMTAQTPSTPPAPTGNATRGKEIFDKALRCYACHGFDAQTGSPRLVPMNRSQDMFLAYVKKPATAGMPSFANAAERDLIDVYAYVRSIPQGAPPADSISVIKSVLDRRAKAH